MSHSRLVQKSISQATDAVSAFQSGNNGEIPIVLVVQPRSLFSFTVSAPSEHKKIWTVSNRFDPVLTGNNTLFHFKTFQSRISHVVSGQAITYECPVSEVPTQDNVMIQVSVSLNFKIFNPTDFVRNLGAYRADELISGTVEEGIRVAVRKIPVVEAKLLRGNQAGKVLELLTTKTENCGMSFDSVKITEVRLPQAMEKALEMTTEMNAARITLDNQQNATKRRVDNEAFAEKQKLEKKNERLVIERHGDKQQAQFSATNALLRMQEEARINVAQAEEQVDVMRLTARADMERAKKSAETLKFQELNTSKESALHIRLKADEGLRMGVLSSQEELAVAEREAKEMRLKAEVETLLSEQTRLQREHEFKMAQRKVLANLAEKGHYNLVGAAGDVMLKSMMEGDFNEEDFRALR